MFLYSYLKLNQSQHFIQYIHCYDWKIFKYNFYNTNRYITNRNVLFSIYSVLIGWYWCKKIILKTFMTARSCWLYYSLRIVLWLQGHVDCTTLSELFYDCKVMLTVLLYQNCFMTARSCWLYYSIRIVLWLQGHVDCTTLSELFYDCKVMLTVLLSQNCFMTARSCWLYYSLRIVSWLQGHVDCTTLSDFSFDTRLN
jgi:hypothetical protein